MTKPSFLTGRLMTVLLGAAALVFSLGAIKVHQIQVAVANAASFQMPPEAVTTLIAPEVQFPATLRAIGTAAAVQGVVVSADLPGVVSEIAFDSGQPVKRGDLLVRLDTRQEHAQLAAASAQLELARLNRERIGGLLPKGVISRSENDRVVAEDKQADRRSQPVQPPPVGAEHPVVGGLLDERVPEPVGLLPCARHPLQDAAGPQVTQA